MYEEIIDHLYVGDDAGYEKLKERDGWSWLRCCKEGPGGHRQLLGYDTLGAPKGPDYIWYRKNKHLMALNIIDLEDPSFIPVSAIEEGIEFISERRNAGDKVLVACNSGHSRSPSIVMLYLRSIGELPQPINRAKRIFKTLYHPYDPAHGVDYRVRELWDEIAPKG
jgi:hypothetical protein